MPSTAAPNADPAANPANAAAGHAAPANGIPVPAGDAPPQPWEFDLPESKVIPENASNVTLGALVLRTMKFEGLDVRKVELVFTRDPKKRKGAKISVTAAPACYQKYLECVGKIKRWYAACMLYVEAPENHRQHAVTKKLKVHHQDWLPALGFCWGGALSARALMLLHNPVDSVVDQFTSTTLKEFQKAVETAAGAVYKQLQTDGETATDLEAIASAIKYSAMDALPLVTAADECKKLNPDFVNNKHWDRKFDHDNGATSLERLLIRFITESRGTDRPPLLVLYLAPSNEDGKHGSCLERRVFDALQIEKNPTVTAADAVHSIDMASANAAQSQLRLVKGQTTLKRSDGTSTTYDFVRLPCHPSSISRVGATTATHVALFYAIYKCVLGRWPASVTVATQALR
eukprot:CAMPEP_0174850082 /NCGR_PEP_ID=MMETSP1114-20130205/19006_1 /TAXON_ID=312471 /ORGANISM="Neobodo designis, Strain CCAP 1951/1" /LENGTH=402 /DNA_ID=CAMNT_0016084511 /DNA_START=32 /DNA_END=1240 /DNA_ORIENTATION=+